jgi:hypothetical protein
MRAGAMSTPDSPPPWRENVLETLAILADEKEQLKYERNAPSVDVTIEMVEIWFSDTYHASDPQFCAQFTAAELDALKDFDSLFESYVKILPYSDGAVQTWLDSAPWRAVMAAAERTRKILLTKGALKKARKP